MFDLFLFLATPVLNDFIGLLGELFRSALYLLCNIHVYPLSYRPCIVVQIYGRARCITGIMRNIKTSFASGFGSHTVVMRARQIYNTLSVQAMRVILIDESTADTPAQKYAQR